MAEAEKTITRRSFLKGGAKEQKPHLRHWDSKWPTPRVAEEYRKILEQDPPLYIPLEKHSPAPKLNIKSSLGRLSTADWNESTAAHLLRRTLFATTFSEINSAEASSMNQIVSDLLADQTLPDPPDTWVTEPPPNWSTLSQEQIQEYIYLYRYRTRELINWWMNLMAGQELSITENMTLFWHNHFATSAQKVFFPQAMYEQNKILRQHCLGNFRELLRRVTFGPAMMIWLDTAHSIESEPNENFARELLELFTIGVDNYTQNDIVEASRAFTGYTTNGVNCNYSYAQRSGVGSYWYNTHDFTPKAFMGQTGNWNGDDIIDIILEENDVADFVCGKIYKWFVYENADDTFVSAMADVFRNNDYEILPVMEYLLTSDHFYDVNFQGAMIRNPMTVTQGALRQLGMNDLNLPANFYLRSIENLGMVPFYPPDVNGWVGYRSWLNSVTLPSRKTMTTHFVDGFSTSDDGNVSYQADVVALAQTLSDPDDAEKLVQDFAKLLFPMPISETLENQLLEVLLDGAAIYDWTISDTSAAPRLRNLLRHMMRMPEYQLI